MPKGAPEFVLSVVKQFNDKVQSATNLDIGKTYVPDFVEAANK